jgi:HNH endonuclease
MAHPVPRSNIHQGKEAAMTAQVSTQVLQLDIQGTPQAWIGLEQAATCIAIGTVAWYEGSGPLACWHGGVNARTGQRSQIEIHPIIALRGVAKIDLYALEPAVDRRKLFRRDRHTCAYCGDVFVEEALQAEHIVPVSRGGPTRWMNLVSACAPCNGFKRDRTPEEAGMPLLYLPYVPSRFEDFLLQGRRIRADVHQWLAARVPKASRWH